MKHVAGAFLFLSERLAILLLAVAILGCIKLVADHTTPEPHQPMVIIPLR